MKNLDLPAITRYFSRQADVVAAYLFGSVARGQETHLSDVDIAVLTQNDAQGERRLERMLKLTADLEAFTDREVQVTLLNQAPPFLAYQVIREGQRLYERNLDERVAFEVRVMKEYFDFQPRLDFFRRSALERIQEAGLGQRKRRSSSALAAARRIHRRLEAASKH